MEEQRAALCAERQIAELVEDHEVGVDQTIGDLPGSSQGLFLFEGIDQFDRGEEADPLSMMLDGLDTERRGDVGLSGAGTTDQHDIVGAVDKLADRKSTRLNSSH